MKFILKPPTGYTSGLGRPYSVDLERRKYGLPPSILPTNESAGWFSILTRESVLKSWRAFVRGEDD